MSLWVMLRKNLQSTPSAIWAAFLFVQRVYFLTEKPPDSKIDMVRPHKKPFGFLFEMQNLQQPHVAPAAAERRSTGILS